jgi:Xaa-Pro aminopeptidase
LIIADMLSEEERKWLNEYHQKVKAELSPLLTDVPVEFLEEMTSEI